MTESRSRFGFEDLFVLDLANNHQGSVAHGTAIIERCAELAARHGVRAAIKFQFRDLPDFVHRDEQANPTNRHVPRFLSTQLSWDDFGQLLAVVRRNGLLAACTPFDEASVERIASMGFDIIKVASCSARDWPLLEAIAASGLPVIASTGGLETHEVDDLVSFLSHRACDYALMHCVSIYPTPDSACHLSNIAGFRQRYPRLTIGWSTHEPPDETVHVGLAYALGARMFERHVGLPTDEITLNAYSSTPEQLEAWFTAWGRCRTLLGQPERGRPLEEERESIDGLRRGVFARHRIEAGATIAREDVYFAFPYRSGQLASGEWKDGIVARAAIQPNAPLEPPSLTIPAEPEELVIKRAIHEVKALLAYANIPLSHEFKTEYSHHYGVGRFREVGAVLITVINRDYAKKILVQLPGQLHPWHFHKLKEETFLLLYGDLVVEMEDRRVCMVSGDTLTLMPGIWHRFWTDKGCVFEEISTTAYPHDSVYRDPKINVLASHERKTVVDHWGRFQLAEKLHKSADEPCLAQ